MKNLLLALSILLLLFGCATSIPLDKDADVYNTIKNERVLLVQNSIPLGDDCVLRVLTEQSLFEDVDRLFAKSLEEKSFPLVNALEKFFIQNGAVEVQGHDPIDVRTFSLIKKRVKIPPFALFRMSDDSIIPYRILVISRKVADNTSSVIWMVESEQNLYSSVNVRVLFEDDSMPKGSLKRTVNKLTHYAKYNKSRIQPGFITPEEFLRTE